MDTIEILLILLGVITALTPFSVILYKRTERYRFLVYIIYSVTSFIVFSLAMLIGREFTNSDALYVEGAGPVAAWFWNIFAYIILYLLSIPLLWAMKVGVKNLKNVQWAILISGVVVAFSAAYFVSFLFNNY